MTLAGQTRKPVIKAALDKLHSSLSALSPGVVAETKQDELAMVIKTVHYNNQKAKRVCEAAKMLLDAGEIPTTATEIQRLPGMGPQLARVAAALIRVAEQRRGAG